MSDALFSTRLRWFNGQGIAKMYGRLVALTEPPILDGVPVYYVQYTPEIHWFDIQPRPCDPKREMYAAEIADADRLLRRLVRLE